MNEWQLFTRFGISVAIGFSIGLQREFSHGGLGKNIPAGERTFALLALAGSLAAMASDQFGEPLIFFGMLISVGLLVVIGCHPHMLPVCLSELSRSGGLSLGIASQGIVIATMTNTLFKGGIVLSAASSGLRRLIWPGMILTVVVGIGATYLL